MRNFIIIITTAFLAVAFCIASNTPTTVPLTAVETQLRKTSQEGIKSSVVVTGKHSNDWGTRNIGGTGIIVRHNYVFTCSHVLGNTYYPKITLPSGEIVTGEVMVEDPDRDMALIKIESKEKLTVCRFSETPPEVGDIILVVGSPHGYHKTVTMGVVSHTDRNITMPNDITLKR
jgi:S1-C subfamily serine protease